MDVRLDNVKFLMPENSKWQLWFAGGALRIQTPVDKVPCWFHRKMQELILGFKWVKDQ